MDRSKDDAGYEINLNRRSDRYLPPRPLVATDADLKRAEAQLLRMLKELTT